MIEPSELRAKAAGTAAPARIAARAAVAGLLAAGAAMLAGHTLFGAERAEARLLVLPADAGGIDTAADAAVHLAASPTFLRTALRGLPYDMESRLTPGLVPSRPADRLRALVDLSAGDTAEERAVAALGRALTVERLASGPVLSVAVTARDGRLAAAAADAVAAAYVGDDRDGGDPGARIVGGTDVAHAAAPGTMLAALLAGLAGAAASAGAALVRLRRGRKAVAEREPLAPPVAGSVPVDVRLAPEGLMAAVAGVWRSAARELEPARCLVVAGAGGGERARVACGLLAGATPSGDGPTVIVDLVARPLAEAPSRAGFAALLDGAASFGEVIQREPGQHVHVIDGTSGHLVLDPPVRRERFAAVIEALVLTYDHVVIHADPFAADGIFAALRAHADGYVLAVDRAGCGGEARAAHAAIVERARVPVTVVSVEGIAVPTAAARELDVAEAA